VTLKEQSQAVIMLRKFYDRARAMPRELLTPEDVQLLDDADKFLNHDDGADQESHGQRRG